jgi:cyclopropane-fatty-acyl-phospholipid synthase
MLESRLIDLFEKRLRSLGQPVCVEFWNGRTVQVGERPKVRVVVRRAAGLRVLARPQLGTVASAYVEGDIDFECNIRDLVAFAERLCDPQHVELDRHDTDNWKWWLHTRRYDRCSIASHYNVSNEFFALWLDRQRVYSCGYFRKPDDSLDAAQSQKLEHICRKLDLRPGERLLDIGCGWGGLLFHAAERYDVHAVGVTLSENQVRFAREEIASRNLADRCVVYLRDYRDLPDDEPFDKIASVGMFEHVGKKNLPGYFAKIHRLLKPGGLVINHGLTSIGLRSGGLSPDLVDFIHRYVFPGGEVPHLAKEIELMARNRLECADIECLRPHYAKTLWHWVERLDARRDEARALVGEKRYRIWRIYMAGYALAFQRGWMSIYQVLAGRPGATGELATPLTRDHVYAA